MLIVIKFQDRFYEEVTNLLVIAESNLPLEKVENIVDKAIRKETKKIDDWTYQGVLDEIEKQAKGNLKYLNYECIERGL